MISDALCEAVRLDALIGFVKPFTTVYSIVSLGAMICFIKLLTAARSIVAFAEVLKLCVGN